MMKYFILTKTFCFVDFIEIKCRPTFPINPSSRKYLKKINLFGLCKDVSPNKELNV